MKVVITYVNNISRAAISTNFFVEINWQIEALRYLQGLRFNKNISSLFEAAVERAIEASTTSFSEIAYNIPDFYGNLEGEILAEIAATLEIDELEYDDLTDLKWRKVIVCIPEGGMYEHESAEITIVKDPEDECHRILANIIEDDRKRAVANLESQKR